MYVFIHKLKGVTISPEIRQMLQNKYKSGMMVYAFNDTQWRLPTKVTNLTNMVDMHIPFAEDVESLIYFTDTCNYTNKKLWFFEENKEAKSWSIYFPSDIKSVDGSFNTSMKYKFNHSEDSSASMLHDIFLKVASNLSKLRMLRFFQGYDKSESALITNGVVHLFTNNQYDVEGVRFSNLDHENDLSADQVKILALSLSLFKFLKGSPENPRDESNALAKLPHRKLKEIAKDAELNEFFKSFDLTV